ncbi:MAG: hypothetical protein ACOYN4_12455, partial [Bacteroidales bacterium]
MNANGSPGKKITSILAIFEEISAPPVMNDTPVDLPSKFFFLTFADALSWRNSLSETQVNYLKSIDKFICTVPRDEIISVSKIVKPENTEMFYTSLSYIIIGAGGNLDIS